METPAEEIAARFKGQFAPAYLTLTSIIQGVALSALVVRVETNYAHFDVANWLLATATLLTFILIWHEYLMQSLAYVWLPTLLDSLVPFSFLVAELFMAHFVYGEQRAWLLVSGMACAVGVLAGWTTYWQAHTPTSANRAILGVVRSTTLARLAFTGALAALFLCLWALYDVLHLAHIRLLVALLAVSCVALCIAATVPYWERVLAYARGKA